jgi:formate dehydrogenase maturation protein FdhE
MNRSDAVLHLVKHFPDLADPVVGTLSDAAQMEHRAHDEIHACMVCDERAAVALIATTSKGKRFVDVCMAHYAEIWSGTSRTDVPYRP